MPKPPKKEKAAPRAEPKPHAPKADLSGISVHAVAVTLPQWCMMVDAELDGMALISDVAQLAIARALETRAYGDIMYSAHGPSEFFLTPLGREYMDTVPLARKFPEPAAAAPQITGWQPILTAPTHTRVLLFGYQENGDREVAMCFREDTGDDDWAFSPQGGAITFKPTLWTPVPTIPEE